MSNKKPVIACDQDIPELGDWLAPRCELIPYQAGELSAAQLRQADGLVVRSVTAVDADLLRDSPCRWVGSVTAGTNHLDFSSLAAAGVRCDFAPGANAPAVCEYVLSALFLAKQQGQLSLASRMGVIGVGEVGSRVVVACEQLGFTVVAYDPPRQAREAAFQSASWEALLNCEVVIVCASYTPSSHQLIDAAALAQWPSLQVLINAARGEIVDYSSVNDKSIHSYFDVWPNEPHVDPALVAQADIATPHIAGYSLQSKWRLSAMIYQACCDFFALPAQLLTCPYPTEQAPWGDQVGLVQLSQHMKAATAVDSGAASFHALRREYPLRSEVGLLRL